MNIKIINAKVKHIEECIEILQNSDLGRTYFTNREKAEVMLTNGISKTGVSVAIDENEKILGFIYYMPNGVFGSYPYLHIIAVKEEYRNLGIGKQMMKYFEENASDHISTKCFLTVDDFNPKAKKLYEVLGYQCVGILPDFYKKGTTCYIMMKEITRSYWEGEKKRE